MEFLDGKVARETQYFGDPFEPGLRARNGSSGSPETWPPQGRPSAARSLGAAD
jgi:hypothetical protein